MQKNPQIALSAVFIAAASILTLIASLILLYFSQLDYARYSFGGECDSDFLGRIIGIAFGFSASILGLISAKQILNQKKFLRCVLGAAFLMLAGSLFLLHTYPSMSSVAYSFAWRPILGNYFVLPIIICTLIGLLLLSLRMRKFDLRKDTLLTVSGAIMVLCITAAVLLGVIFYLSYDIALRIPHGSTHAPFYSTIITVCALALGLPAAILLLKKKFIPIALSFIVLVIVSALSLSFIFKFIGYSYVWLNAFRDGLSHELPIILLSATALVFAIYAKKQQKKNLKDFGALKGTLPFTAEDELQPQTDTHP